MKTAFVILTTECDRNCDYCFNRSIPPRPGDALRRQPVAAVARLRALGVGGLILTGGEPTQAPELLDWLRAAAAAGLGTLLITNGEALTRATAAAWVNAGLTAVTLTANAAADPHPPAPAALTASIRDRLALLADAGLPDATLIACATRTNLDQVEAIAALAARERRGLILQPLFLPAGHPRAADAMERMTPAEWDDGYLPVLAAWAVRQGAENYLQLWVDLYRGAGGTPVSCFMGSESLVVDPDGSVFPCFHRRDLAAGNLLLDSPRELTLKLFAAADAVLDAPCFGKSCLSLFVGR